MPAIRFKHVFVAIVLISGLCALLLPARVSDVARGQLDALLVPVSWPARKLAEAAHRQLRGPQRVEDPFRGESDKPRTSDEVLKDNQRLVIQVASMAKQIEELAKRAASREKLGDVQQLCDSFAVIGSDSGNRQSLILRGSSRDGLKVGMPVLCPEGLGLAGRISIAGIGGAHVQLLTDVQFTVVGKFERPRHKADGSVDLLSLLPIDTPAPLVQGDGRGRMVIKTLKYSDVEKLVVPGDWVVLEDPDGWPLILQHKKIGEVESVKRDNLGFAEIVVKPAMNLMQLAEVQVLVR